MRSLARDIQLTLFIKLSLLILLWFVCFKQTEKPEMNTQKWLLGSSLHTDTTQATVSKKLIGPHRKLAEESILRGEAERRTTVYTSVHEDSSTASTKQDAPSVTFTKRYILTQP